MVFFIIVSNFSKQKCKYTMTDRDVYAHNLEIQNKRNLKVISFLGHFKLKVKSLACKENVIMYVCTNKQC